MIYGNSPQSNNQNIDIDVLAEAVTKKLQSDPNRQQLTLPISFETVAVLKRALGLSIDPNAGAGTVSSVSVTTANGVSGTVSNPTTTPTISISLGAITPTTVNGLDLDALAVGFSIKGGTTSKTLTVPLDATVSGTNTGDQDLSGYAPLASPTFTGTVTLPTGLSGIAKLTSGVVSAITPLAGTKVYYVSDSSGGAVDRKLTFTDGILTSET
jgi:hypothetical protein